MNCSEFMELLDNYELLDEIQRAELDLHSAECDACRGEYEFFKSIISVSSSIPVPKTPDTLIAEVNARLDSERAPIIRFKPDFRVLSTVAACLAIGLAVGINNGYIKKSIAPNDADGVISETVITASETPAAVETEDVTPSEVPMQVEAETETAEPVVATQSAESTYEPIYSPTNKPVKSTPQATQKVQSTPKAQPTETVATQTPVQTPEATPDDVAEIEDYEVEERAVSDEHAYRPRFSTSRTGNQFSDYLYVKSEDMGAVISTMNELGFEVSNGYYMGSREDFNKLMNILSERGIGYECMLQHNMGENIAFNLQYS